MLKQEQESHNITITIELLKKEHSGFINEVEQAQLDELLLAYNDESGVDMLRRLTTGLARAAGYGL